jgi:hypothetical protein
MKPVSTISRPVQGDCIHCQAKNSLSEVICTDTFQQGVYGTIVELVASVPVIGCDKCEETWTDDRAAQIKHKMVVELFGEIPEQLPKSVTLDDYYYTEVLNSSFLLHSMFEEHIATHPVTLQDLEVKSAADAASEALFRLYQTAGSARHNFMEKESGNAHAGNQS